MSPADIAHLQAQIDLLMAEVKMLNTKLNMANKRIDGVEHLATARDKAIEQRLCDLETQK